MIWWQLLHKGIQKFVNISMFQDQDLKLMMVITKVLVLKINEDTTRDNCCYFFSKLCYYINRKKVMDHMKKPNCLN